MANQATIHVQYKVGTISQTLNNVNLEELTALLSTMIDKLYDTPDDLDAFYKTLWVSPAEAQKLADVLSIEGLGLKPVVEETINQLVHTDNLKLTGSVSCDFYKQWWRSKTRAGTVMCLLQAAIAAEKKTAQEQIDAKIRGFPSVPTTATTNSTATQLAANAWLERWKRTHG
jgi:hypothetical protein